VQVAALVGTDAAEEWTIINLTGDAHPIHMHEVLFEVRCAALSCGYCSGQ
jgi:FtsP/CotA-like multicopper oxidase with cupredoxin domain